MEGIAIRRASALLASGALMASLAAAVMAAPVFADEVCDNDWTSPLTGEYASVTVPVDGSCVLDNATVTGNIRVRKGAWAFIGESTVNGNVTVGEDAGVRVVGGVVQGNLQGMQCDYIDVYDWQGVGAVYGNVRARRCDEVYVAAVSIEGNLQIHESGWIWVAEATIDGNCLAKGDDVVEVMWQNVIGGNAMGQCQIEVAPPPPPPK